MGLVTFVITQHNQFIKRVKWIVLCQPAALTDHVRVERS